jgi:hypothetical protein
MSVLGCCIRLEAYGSNDSWAIRSDQSGLALGLENVCYSDHIYQMSTNVLWKLVGVLTMLWNTLGDAIIIQPMSREEP